MDAASFRHRLPGLLASGLMLISTGLWAFWGFMEMYYEGWGLPGLEPVAYLIPAAIFLALWLVAESWPRVGGSVLIVFGALFTGWIFSMQMRRGPPTLLGILSWIPVTVMLLLVGTLFIIEGVRRKRLRERGWTQPAHWARRNIRLLVPYGTVLVIGLVCTAVNWHVFARTDDGDRGARLIHGGGVSLVWAPAGMGWAQSARGVPRNLSWNQIALYGMSPVGFGEKPGHGDRDATREEMRRYGLFRYLAADGRTLQAEPVDIWRMPTVNEIVRSLGRDGGDAGCTPPAEPKGGRAECARTPDKETPLWATNIPFIYMWAAQEYDDTHAYYVSYNGWVRHQPKTWGNPRHGYRFVRDPWPEDWPVAAADPVGTLVAARVTHERR